MRLLSVLLAGLALNASVLAEPHVLATSGQPDTNYTVDRIMGRLDGQTPRLEVVRNGQYGNGVVAAGMDNGILKVHRISAGYIETIGTKTGYPAISQVLSVRFDWTGYFGNKLFLSVAYDINGGGYPDKTEILSLDANGNITTHATLGSNSDILVMKFEFGGGSQSEAGMYLEDVDGTNGTSFYKADPGFNLTKVSQSLLPAGRTDLDITGMKTDTTGRYGNKLTMTDDDYIYGDYKSVIYQLWNNGSNWQWTELNTPMNTSQRKYTDLEFSSGGSFGQQLYVVERYSNSVQAVEPNGSDKVFARGFTDIESVSVSNDGQHMYVSDINGIWHIYRNDVVTVGPEYVMREPKSPDNGVFTNTGGVDSVRLLFNEPLVFDNDDVVVTDQNGLVVPHSVTGSGSQFIIIAFGQPLLENRYNITVNDSVVSSITNAAIDGDSNGLAGGDFVFSMEHRQRHDSDNNNKIDMADLADLAENWLWKK